MNKDSSDKIDLIVQAAQQVFGQYGFNKASMNDIANAIGLSKAALYYYFPDKESLFQAVVLREEEAFKRVIDPLLQQPIPATELLRQYVDLRYEHFKKLINLSKVKNDWLNNYTDSFIQLSEKIRLNERQIIVFILEKGVRNQEFRPQILQHADLFMRMLQGLRLINIRLKAMQLLDPDDYATLADELREATRMFIISHQQ